jgi:hypothetical protein
MEKNTERILKSSDVEISGRVQLGSIASGPGSAARSATTLAFAQATVVENNPEFALIEVVCPCGRKTTVRCEYTKAGQAAE